MITPFIFILLATYFIWKVSDSFDTAATYLTRNLSEGIKGPTVNAIASSFPELLISSFFLFYIGDVQGFSAGFATIIGSSIFNVALIPTIAFIVMYYKQGIKTFPIDKRIIQQDGIFLIITEIILLIALWFGGVSIALASVLILLYIFYIFHVIHTRSKDQKISIEKEVDISDSLGEKPFLSNLIQIDLRGLLFKNKDLTTFRAITILVISILIISVSCKQLVSSSEHLSEIFNVNLFFVTFFITAIASSVPDTILSVKDAVNKKYKDAFSNAYASNIFDICIGIGLPVLVYLLINGKNEILITSTSGIIYFSSVLLLIFTSIITFIYWLKNINIYRTILIIGLYFVFLTTVYYIS